MDSFGSAFWGQFVEQSPQSWQSHGSRLSSSGSFNPRTAYWTDLRGKGALSVERSQPR
jgi:hypothetical protein